MMNKYIVEFRTNPDAAPVAARFVTAESVLEAHALAVESVQHVTNGARIIRQSEDVRIIREEARQKAFTSRGFATL